MDKNETNFMDTTYFAKPFQRTTFSSLKGFPGESLKIRQKNEGINRNIKQLTPCNLYPCVIEVIIAISPGLTRFHTCKFLTVFMQVSQEVC